MTATKLLQQAFEKAAKLSVPEQDELAQWILDELSEREHEARLSKPYSGYTLREMVDQARRDIAEGNTRPIESLFEQDDDLSDQ